MKMIAMIVRRTVLVAMLVSLFFLGKEAIKSWEDYQASIRAQDKLIDLHATLMQKLEAKEDELDRLMNDPTYYEQLAREEFGMVKGNEIVFVVSSKPLNE